VARELGQPEVHASLGSRSREKRAENIRVIRETERELRGSLVLEIRAGSRAIAERLAEAVGQSGVVWGADIRDVRIVRRDSSKERRRAAPLRAAPFLESWR
jgi:ubiquinone/menaquinone biosynthesis C-methylase UbiE